MTQRYQRFRASISKSADNANQRPKKIQLLTRTITFCLILNFSAYASSSWSQASSWSGEESTTSRRSTRSRDLSSDPSPFSPGSNNLAIDLGQVFLMGNLNSNYSDSIGTQLHYTYGVSDLFA